MNAILRISLPLTLWLAGFSAVYGLHGLLCSSRWAALAAALPGRALLIGAALLVLALQALLIGLLGSPRWPAPEPAIHRVSLTLAITAFASSAWTLLPVLTTSHCL
ncbi:hypothetical protein [Limimaricola litoreus]|uniref:Uncharacterized protein n=1 Tax=Limimaricola litoreus TaxID=2955316 RepID=A0A9X2FUY9_9RHOB|nr:hypothetical protein [Limimaricola litoreus]MCP1168951.1 hypothetical protein [Limimaricola litoreus]